MRRRTARRAGRTDRPGPRRVRCRRRRRRGRGRRRRRRTAGRSLLHEQFEQVHHGVEVGVRHVDGRDPDGFGRQRAPDLPRGRVDHGRFTDRQHREEPVRSRPRARASSRFCCRARPARAMTAVTTSRPARSSAPPFAIARTPLRCPRCRGSAASTRHRIRAAPAGPPAARNGAAGGTRCGGGRGPRRTRCPRGSPGRGARRRRRARPTRPAAGRARRSWREAVGSHRRQGDGPLGGEGPGVPGVGLAGDGVGVRLRDGDERRLVGDLEQRHAVSLARGHEGVGRAGTHHLGAEAERRHTVLAQPRHVGVRDRVGDLGVGAELRAGGEEPLPGGEERRRVLEVGAVQPGQGCVEHVVVHRRGQQPEAEVGTVQEGSQRCGHVSMLSTRAIHPESGVRGGQPVPARHAPTIAACPPPQRLRPPPPPAAPTCRRNGGSSPPSPGRVRRSCSPASPPRSPRASGSRCRSRSSPRAVAWWSTPTATPSSTSAPGSP